MNQDRYKSLYIEDTEEHLKELSDNLLSFERDDKKEKNIDNIFRIMHTLKGSSAAMGYSEISEITHKAEDLMDKIKNKEIKASSQTTDILFNVLDIIQDFVNAIKHNNEPNLQTDLLITGLDKLLGVDKKKIQPIPVKQKPTDLKLKIFSEDIDIIRTALEEGKNCYRIILEIDPSELIKWMRCELILEKIESISEIVKIVPSKDDLFAESTDGKFAALIITDMDQPSLKKKLKVSMISRLEISSVVNDGEKFKYLSASKGKKEENKKAPPKEKRIISTGSNTIRVSIEKLDDFMNLIGEIITNISGLKKAERDMRVIHDDIEIYREMNQMSEKLMDIANELQISVMDSRMSPVSDVFNQFYRIIRDIARDEQKDVNLIISGEETEIDRRIIDKLGQPLVRIVRNLIMYGIESPEKRIEKGKTRQGNILLSALRSGNIVFISIMDDGRGFNTEKYRKDLSDSGLIPIDKINSMDDNEVLNLLLEAPFSNNLYDSETQNLIDDLISVKNWISELNGRISIKNTPDEGMEFILALPLNLTIIPVLKLKSCDREYAIPVAEIKEIVKKRPDDIYKKNNISLVRVRENVIPVFEINGLIENKSIDLNLSRSIGQSEIFLIIVQYQQLRIALLADKTEGEQEVVLKPIEKNYKQIKSISGVCIMGDGNITMIIDTMDIIDLINEKLGNSAILQISNQIIEKKVIEKKSEDKTKYFKKTDIEINKLLFRILKRSLNESAESFSKLTQKDLNIYTPVTKLMSKSRFINQFKNDLDKNYILSNIKIQGLFKFSILLIIKETAALNLYDIICANPSGTTKAADDDVIEGMGEINNIIGSTFINKLANTIDKEINPEPPVNSYNSLGVLINQLLTSKEYVKFNFLSSDTVIEEKEKKEFHARLIIMTNKEELSELLRLSMENIEK